MRVHMDVMSATPGSDPHSQPIGALGIVLGSRASRKRTHYALVLALSKRSSVPFLTVRYNA
jgi:hypothetical protein